MFLLSQSFEIKFFVAPGKPSSLLLANQIQLCGQLELGFVDVRCAHVDILPMYRHHEWN